LFLSILNLRIKKGENLCYSTRFGVSGVVCVHPFLFQVCKNTLSLSSSVEFVLAPQHRMSYDPEVTTKEDFDY